MIPRQKNEARCSIENFNNGFFEVGFNVHVESAFTQKRRHRFQLIGQMSDKKESFIVGRTHPDIVPLQKQSEYETKAFTTLDLPQIL